MNNLEEAAFSKNISARERQVIDSSLGELVPYLQQLKSFTGPVAREAEQTSRHEQYLILRDIVEYNRRLIPQNNQTLNKILDQERKLQDALTVKAQKDINPAKVKNTEVISDIDKKIEHLQLQYIEQLEQTNFAQVATIKKVDRSCAPSFNKIWIWILEVFYGVPSSKYDWEDFSRKALSKNNDSGNELRRKMIIYEVNKMSPLQAKDLDNFTNSDIPLLKDKLPQNPDLFKFFDSLGLFNQIYKLNQVKFQHKKDQTLTHDIRVQEEERNAIVASQRLNTLKYDIATDVQNLYLLIDYEFRE